MPYRPSTSFKDYSNKKKTAVARIMNTDSSRKPAYCNKHLLGRIEQMDNGEWFEKCAIGHQFNEKCDLRDSNDQPLRIGADGK